MHEAKKDEFEKRLEELGKRLKEKAKLEERLREVEKKVSEIDKKISRFEFPKEFESKLVSLKSDLKSLEDKVWFEIDEVKKSFNELKAGILKEIDKKVKESIGTVAEEKIKEGQKDTENKINLLKAKVSEIENKINKLIEILEAMS
jgi:chromosome segregation ATPase